MFSIVSRDIASREAVLSRAQGRMPAAKFARLYVNHVYSELIHSLSALHQADIKDQAQRGADNHRVRQVRASQLKVQFLQGGVLLTFIQRQASQIQMCEGNYERYLHLNSPV